MHVSERDEFIRPTAAVVQWGLALLALYIFGRLRGYEESSGLSVLEGLLFGAGGWIAYYARARCRQLWADRARAAWAVLTLIALDTPTSSMDRTAMRSRTKCVRHPAIPPHRTLMEPSSTASQV